MLNFMSVKGRAFRASSPTRRAIQAGALALLAALAWNGAAQAQSEFPAGGDPAGPPTENVAPPRLTPDYRIGVGDVLAINVWREPEASYDAVAVRSDGKISVPLVKEVHVKGLTPTELEKVLTRKYAEFINDPEVTVIIRQINSQMVYIIGGVMRPGALPLSSQMTILQALAVSGGLTDYAKKKKIYVLREMGGKQMQLAFDYPAVLSGKNSEQNVFLLPGDTIVVPE